MTVEESIKHCEDAAEKDKGIAEFCNNIEPYTEFFEKEAEKYFQIADWLKVLKNIMDVGSCNECKSRGVCKYEPEAGHMTRFNCPFYTDDIYSELKKRNKKEKENKMTEGGMIFMVKDCKLYECDICGKKETVEEGYEPTNIVHFELYDLKPCICRRCLKLAINASGIEMSITEFADKCKECGAIYGKLLKQKKEE